MDAPFIQEKGNFRQLNTITPRPWTHHSPNKVKVNGGVLGLDQGPQPPEEMGRLQHEHSIKKVKNKNKQTKQKTKTPNKTARPVNLTKHLAQDDLTSPKHPSKITEILSWDQTLPIRLQRRHTDKKRPGAKAFKYSGQSLRQQLPEPLQKVCSPFAETWSSSLFHIQIFVSRFFVCLFIFIWRCQSLSVSVCVCPLQAIPQSIEIIIIKLGILLQT